MSLYTFKGTSGTDSQYGGNSSQYISGFGWVYADCYFQGFGGDDYLQVYDGKSTIDGGSGNDKITGGSDNDSLIGGDGNDYISGGEGQNVLLGGSGADTLEQNYNYGIDTMIGGSGDDSYIIRDAGTTIIELGGGGVDTVRSFESFTLPSFVEVLEFAWSDNSVRGTGNAQHNTIIGNSNANTLSGMAGDDSLDGNGGNDYLDGGDGNDTLKLGPYYNNSGTLIGGNGDDILTGSRGSDYMNGGSGDDIYYVDYNASETPDSILESINGGYDEVYCSADSFQLLDNIEALTMIDNANTAYGNYANNLISGNDRGNLITADDGNDTLNGMGGSDTITGGSGNDILDGGVGADQLIGGSGNDIYYIEMNDTYNRDNVVEMSFGGIDKVISSVNYTLPVNVEQLQLSAGARNGTGNSVANTLEGNNLNNNLVGDAGADSLIGLGGADNLLGGEGSDLLDGGAGNDMLNSAGTASRGRGEIDSLIGGEGADRFIVGDARGRFYDDGNTANAGRSDYALITDFTVGTDRLQLDGAASNYYIGASGVNGVSGQGLWFEQGATDELVAIVRSGNSIALTADNLIKTAAFV